MNKNNKQNSDIALLIAELTTRDDAGRPVINTQSLGRNDPKTHTIQNALSESGLYVSPKHRFHNDGVVGEVTKFGIQLHTAPQSGSKDFLNKTAIQDTSLSEQDILKMQIALNAATDDPQNKITVDGIMGPQTANRFADYLSTQKQAMPQAEYTALTATQSGDIFGKMQKYVEKTKLDSLGIQSTIRPEFTQAHNHDGEHHHPHPIPRFEAPTTTPDLNQGGIVLSDPIKGGRITDSMRMRSGSRTHHGLDIASGGDNSIYAPADGSAYVVDPKRALDQNLDLSKSDIQNSLMSDAGERVARTTSRAFDSRIERGFDPEHYEHTIGQPPITGMPA